MTIRKPISLAVAAVLSAAAMAGAQTPTVRPAGVPLDRVVGVVGSVPITWFEVQEKINALRQQGQEPPTDSAAYAKLARDVLNEMIDEEVLVQKAKDLKVEVSDADVTNSVENQIKQVRGRFASEQEFRSQLQLAGFGTPEEYRRFLTEQIRRGELQRQVITKLRGEGKLVSTGVTEKDVREAFERGKTNLPKRPASVTFRQVVINPKPSAQAKEVARVKAESLLAELRRPGADFAVVAKRESMDEGSKDIGGDLGWARRGPQGFVPEFERWAFNLEPGRLSPVVETPFGFHIIRVDQRRPGEVKSRHILIKPVIDSADVTRARLEADSVAAAWRRGVPFDSLAKLHHDYANKEETSLLQPYPIDSLPQTYQQALRGKQQGEISTFQIPGRVANVPKFVVVQLASFEEGGEVRLEDVRERIRDQLSQESAFRRLIDQLRKQTFVAVRLDATPPPPPAPAR